MKALRTKHNSALDSPPQWNKYLRQWFDAEAFQQRIDERAGLNRDGKSVVVLRWGQDVKTTAFGEETPRYWTRRTKRVGQIEWWTVPRWIFETRLEPEQYYSAWVQSRYSMRVPDEGAIKCSDCGGEPKLIDGRAICGTCMSPNINLTAVIDKGPPPSEYFTYMMDASVHEGFTVGGQPACCARAWHTDRSRCWGEYRQPNDFDLQVISRTTREMQASKRNPYRALTPIELAEIEMSANLQMEKSEEAMQQYEAEMHKDFDKRMSWLLKGEQPPAFVDFGAKTEGGLVLPFTAKG